MQVGIRQRWEDKHNVGTQQSQTERWGEGTCMAHIWASWWAATHQFLSEPGYSFIDTLEAFQLACGQWPVTPAGTPGRWEKLSGLPQRHQRLSTPTCSLLQTCLLLGSWPRERPRLLLQPGLPFQIGRSSGLQPQLLSEGLQAEEVVIGRYGCPCWSVFLTHFFHLNPGHRHFLVCPGSQTWEVLGATQEACWVAGQVLLCNGLIQLWPWLLKAL